MRGWRRYCNLSWQWFLGIIIYSITHSKVCYLNNIIYFCWTAVVAEWHEKNSQYNRIGWFMVFNATFNNISVISWWSVLLVKETGVSGENHWPVTSHWQTFIDHIMLYRVHLTMSGVRTHNMNSSCHRIILWIYVRHLLTLYNSLIFRFLQQCMSRTFYFNDSWDFFLLNDRNFLWSSLLVFYIIYKLQKFETWV